MVPKLCQWKCHVTSYSLPQRLVQVRMLLKDEVRVKLYSVTAMVLHEIALRLRELSVLPPFPTNEYQKLLIASEHFQQ